MLSPLSNGLVAVALVAGSCSGTGEGDNPTAPTSMTTPPTTVVVATTAAPTTEAPTTLAPTTTIDPIEAEKAAVAAAVVQARAVAVQAYQNVESSGPLAALDLSYTVDGPARLVVLNNRQSLLDTGWRVRENTAVPDQIRVESVEFLDGPPPTSARVQVCIVDAAIIFEPNATPDGDDAIVNDEVLASRSNFSMVVEDGLWKLDEVVDVESWPEATECPAGE